jgi:prevent-host-death family protein
MRSKTPVPKTSWTEAEAKAKFSEVVSRAQSHGPQTITRHGHAPVVLVSAEEWERKTKRPGNLAEFFAASGNPKIDASPDQPKREQ